MSTTCSSYVPPHAWHGSGPPLLLIAGLGGKGSSWRPYLQTAAKTHCVLTFDNRGAGAAPALEGPVTIRELAADVLALMDALGLEHVPVMGRSMGGKIAQELALMAPERVSRLVLVATSGRSDAHLAQIYEHWARMAELGVPAEVRHRSSMLWCLSAASLENTEAIAPYLQAKNSADRPGDYAIQARACARHDALERLRQLDVATLVIAGSDDRLTPVAHAHALVDAIPGSRLELIPDAGHLVYLEQPEKFARAASDFLNASPQRSQPKCPTSTKPW